MHVISGLPRAGSTLLCNILAQDPNNKVSSTSILPMLTKAVMVGASGSLEYKAMIDADRDRNERRLMQAIRGLCCGWYADEYESDDNVIFDKSRGWMNHIDLYHRVFPTGRMIALIRDLREVFASTEKQHRNTPLFCEAVSSIDDRLKDQFSPGGVIGGPLKCIADMVKRNYPMMVVKNILEIDDLEVFNCEQRVLVMKYEQFAANPKLAMKIIRKFLRQGEFEHDFENVVNQATDPDGLYLYKYPHAGEGKVRPPEQQWGGFLCKELGDQIVQQNQWFYNFFGYGTS